MALVPRKSAANAAMSILNALQDFPVESQAVALAVVFTRLCKHSGIRPVEAMQIAENVHTDGERVHPAFGAVDLYIQGEHVGI